MRYLLFDDENRADLLPLAYTRPVAEFRIGILTIAEKWFRRMPSEAVFGGYVTEPYLQDKYPSDLKEDQLWINASVCPNDELIEDVLSLEMNESLFDEHEHVIAFRTQATPGEVGADTLITLGVVDGLLIPCFFFLPVYLLSQYSLSKEKLAVIQAQLPQQ